VTYQKYIFNSEKPDSKETSSNIIIKTVTNQKELKEYDKVPRLVYKDDDKWVPGLWPEFKYFFKTQSPFWEHAETKLFIAYKNGVACGSITGFIDTLYIESQKDKVGYFGYFECIKDYDVAKTLFEVCEDWLKSKNISKIRGPIQGRIDMKSGFLTNAFDNKPYALATYNPKYYNDFVKKFGFKKIRDLYAYYLDLSKPIPKYLEEAKDKCEADGIRIRKFNKLRTRKEMNWWIPLMKELFSFHWEYIDVSEEEVRSHYEIKKAKWIADSKLFLIAENEKNEPIAFKWATPDYNYIIKRLNGRLGLTGIIKFLWHQRNIKRGRFNFVGIDKKYRGKKIGSCMNYYTILEMKRRGYTNAECGWIDEENIASQRTIEKTGAVRYKTFRIYQKDIK
jgi:predicted acetyltransferase